MIRTDDALTVCVIGAGPRGLSVLERICANAGGIVRPVEVHLVDPYPPGAGAVWRTDQPGELLMNTVASQVTLFTDDSVDCAGPSVPGPSLYEWACAIRDRAIDQDLPAWAVDEARRLGPDTYPTRAFHGHYLEWVLRHLLRTAPAHVTVHTHRTTAVALDDDPSRQDDGAGRQDDHPSDRPQTVTLENGGRLTGLDAVVLALGHGGVTESPEERALRSFADRHGLTYVAPANPADTDLSGIAPGTPVALRGLGLNFFDCLALLTEGRGGTFKESESGLVYLPSGNEPVLYAGSRRGVPYHARGENEKGSLGRHEPRFLTPDVIAGLRRRVADGHPLGFRHDLWPIVDREIRTVHHEAWIRAARGPEAAAEFVRSCLADAGGWGEAALLDRYAVPPGERWDWTRIERPYGERPFTGRADFRHWLLAYLRRDVGEARRGNVNGPLKAALDALRDLRNEIRLVVDHGGVSGDSYRAELDGWYTPLNAFTSIGPPAFRVEQLVALIEADVLQVLGPGMRVRARAPGGGTEEGVGEGLGEGGFLVDAELVDDPPVRVEALIEARLPAVALRRSTDPLLRGLLASGACVPYRLEGDPGHEPGGLAVTDSPPRLVDAAGRPHPRRFAFGVPVEGVRWVTAVGIRPGVGSVTLEDSDAIARAALGLGPAGPQGQRAEGPGASALEAAVASVARRTSGTGSR
ncbi:FAD/NAD(P)-binding protein [Streptomyces europaeiscabiei]|uniref:FAD/NAD(P)-binding protein n=2 Tax=Streptomyces europaeiscabiei TaxID=146819 RepID=UPI0029BD0703|nr:FAD/NAD(P)-binding protein [Streptomyces europaeiscabiei]MDX2529539.1 FAD/NAD(P)-binding protein [Streptomyces europaeiscabiei]MDX2768137.1 FAD/NAD(P)-binding protein [Streptomyces europaeiscabiei]